MTTLIIGYVATVTSALVAWILVNRDRRQAMREDLSSATIALYGFTMWLTAYPQTMWRLHRYKPRHARYAPATRAWSVTL